MKKCFRIYRVKQRRIKRSLRDTFAHRVLGERIFGRHIWNFDVNSIAGGVSLGLFIAFTPTIPFQMILCAMGAIVLGVNLPVALIACWITNPVTAVPIYWSAHRLGRYIYERLDLWDFVKRDFVSKNQTLAFMKNSLYLWTGSMIFAIGAAFAGNIFIRLAGSQLHHIKEKKSGKK